MCSANFNSLISKFPQETDSIQRLVTLLKEGKNDKSKLAKKFTLDRLYNMVTPKSEFVLAQILTYLVNNGSLEMVITVESPISGAIEDFHSLDEVPEVIHDFYRDIEMHVTMDNINVYYRVTSRFFERSRQSNG